MKFDKSEITTKTSSSRTGLILGIPLCLGILTGCSSNQQQQAMPSPLVVKTSDLRGTSSSRVNPMPFMTSEPTVQQENDPVFDPMKNTAPDPLPGPSLSPAQSSGARTMLSFVNADIPGVIQALAKFTGRNFVVDPRVKGQLTLISQDPVDPDTAYAMLLSALRMHGFAVVDVDGVNRVVPEADAKLQGVSVGQATSSQAKPGELSTSVFPLKYENANNLVPVLRPLISPNNTINAYPANNTLVITDYSDNLDRISKIIASIDRPESFSTDVVPIRHGIATDVAALATQMLRTGDSAQGGSSTVVIADPKNNSVLIRASSPQRLSMARNLVKRIDSPGNSQGNYHVVYLRNAQATQLAQVLKGLMSGHDSKPGTQINTQQASVSPASPTPGNPQPSSAASLGFVNLSANRSTLGQSQDLASIQPLESASLEPVGFTTGNTTIQADPATNTLLISAPPPVYRNLRQVIDKLDQRRAQVLVETLIVEVNAEDASQLGVQWMVGANNLNPNSSAGFVGGTNLGGTSINPRGMTTIDTLGQGMSLGVVSGAVNVLGNQILNLGFLARAMQAKGGVNVLSTPNLMTLDNEEASIMVGKTVPFVTGQYTTNADGASNPFQTITREDVGLTLRVRPQISEGGTVKLSIYQEVSSIDNAASTALNSIVTRKRALDTDVLIDDGQIIVLGGLLEDQFFDDTRSVPLLGDIPGLGALFRYDSKQRTKTNLMVFLRPHIIRNSRDSANITLDRYNYMMSAQQQQPAGSNWITQPGNQTQLPPMALNPQTGLLDLRQVPANTPETQAHGGGPL